MKAILGDLGVAVAPAGAALSCPGRILVAEAALANDITVAARPDPAEADSLGDLSVAGLDLPFADMAALRNAVRTLERTTLADRMAALAGRPLDILGSTLPVAITDAVAGATETALKAALKLALTSLPKESASPGRRMHQVLAATSGAAGGAFGLLTLPVELAVSTTLMLRAIADIARREGEDLADPEVALACLQVFALGGRAKGGASEDLSQSGYFAVRGMLSKSVAEAARLVAERGLADEAAPALVRFVAQIASRFGIVVSQKVSAGAVPIIGAIGGAGRERRLHEPFPGHRGRAFHGPPPGARPRTRGDPGELRDAASAGGRERRVSLRLTPAR
jgi:hypothetical protein